MENDFDFTKIKGFKNLPEEGQILAKKLIYNFINGWGLETRKTIKPATIKTEFAKKRFKLTYKKDNNLGFSYLYFNGSVG